MKIVADENIPFVKEAFSSLGEVTTLPGRSLSRKNLEGAQILLVRSVTRVGEQLLENTAVKFVASATIGFDHLDTQYLKKRGIPWATAPGCNATAAAEYVITALLHIASLKGISLSGKAAGIIGCGNVGSRVRNRLAGLGINTIINDPPLQQREPERKFVSLDEALGADIITLHVPLKNTGEHPTRHLLGQQMLNRIHDGSILINTSRGSVIDGGRLLERLRRNYLLTVLDVWEDEPNIDSELLDECIIGTPHIAGYSLDGRVRGTEMIYQACCRQLDITPTWQADSILDNVENSTIDLVNADNTEAAVRQAVNHVYAITTDDQALRNILSLKKNQRGKAFDQLRRDYPLRREFACYTAIVSAEQRELGNTLQTLGFNISSFGVHYG